MTLGAAEVGEDLLAARGSVAPGRIVGDHPAGRRQARLEGDQRRDVAGRQFVGVLVAIEIVGPRPAFAEALVRLKAEMGVGRVDHELAQRREHALLAERADGQIGIDAIQLREVDQTIGHHGQLAEIHPLAGQGHGLRLAALASGGDRAIALGAEFGRHFAGEQLDEAGAEQADRAALVGELRIERIEVGALEAFRDEGVGGEIAGAAEHGHVVARLAIVGIGAGRPPEGRVGRPLAQGRDDRLGRHRSSEAVGGGEARGEQVLAFRDQLVQLIGGQRAFKRGEIDVVPNGLFGPRNRIVGERVPAHQQRQANCGPRHTRLASVLVSARPMRHTLASEKAFVVATPGGIVPPMIMPRT